MPSAEPLEVRVGFSKGRRLVPARGHPRNLKPRAALPRARGPSSCVRGPPIRSRNGTSVPKTESYVPKRQLRSFKKTLW